MHIIFFIIGVSLLMALGFLGAFIWSMRTGQQDDLYTPALRMLLDDEPWTTEKVAKKSFKHTAFLLISFAIANTFLAYIIGRDGWLTLVMDNPAAHLTGLAPMGLFTGVFYLVFARLREIVCTTICPYGRLQGVLLDKNSLVVAYDYIRGEPRGKLTKAALLYEPVSVAIFFITLPEKTIRQNSTPLRLDVLVGNKVVDQSETTFLGPVLKSERVNVWCRMALLRFGVHSFTQYAYELGKSHCTHLYSICRIYRLYGVLDAPRTR